MRPQGSVVNRLTLIDQCTFPELLSSDVRRLTSDAKARKESATVQAVTGIC